MISADYSQFYRGMESIRQYGGDVDGFTGKDTLVRYEFRTKDDDGNTIMEKMSKEETFKVMKEISSQYGDNVIVEFSGDGMAKLIESKSWSNRELTEEEKAEREVRDKAFQAMIKPLEGTHKILSSDELKSVSDFTDVVKQQSPEWYAKMTDLMSRMINRRPGDHFADEYMELMKEGNRIYNDFKQGKGKPVLIDFDALLGRRAGDYRAKREEQRGYSLSKRAEDLTKAYADLYHEIVTGHKNRSRKSYMADASSESGYRLMTLEEELAALDKAYVRQTERIDEQTKHNDDLTKALKAYGEQLLKAKRNKNAEDVFEQYRERLSEQSKIPGNLAERMTDVIERFKKAYKDSSREALALLPQWAQEDFFIAK